MAMSEPLRQGLVGLRPLTDAALAVLAIASGIYTYIGVRGLLEGNDWLSFGAAIAYSGAVSVGIFVFWSYVLWFFPHVRRLGGRIGLSIATCIGCLAIVAMSSWLNAAALAGAAAVEQHLKIKLEQYQEGLDDAHNHALASLALGPDLELRAEEFAALAVQEASGGQLTGASGQGAVSAFLVQATNQFEALAGQIEATRTAIDAGFEAGKKLLAEMEAILAATGPVARRGIAFSEHAVALRGRITELQQLSMAAVVRRAAEGLPGGLVMPATAQGNARLQARQSQAVANIEARIRQVSERLVEAADRILDMPVPEVPRFTRLSTADAVWVYRSSFIPSWAGAVAIDLLPAVLVLILVIVQGAIRAEEEDARVVPPPPGWKTREHGGAVPAGYPAPAGTRGEAG